MQSFGSKNTRLAETKNIGTQTLLILPLLLQINIVVCKSYIDEENYTIFNLKYTVFSSKNKK